MADEEEIVVSVQGDTPGNVEVVHQDDAVAEMKKQYEALEADNRRRQEREEAANREAAQARQEAGRLRQEVQTARSEVADRELDTVVQGIAAAQAKAEAAQKDYEAAVEAGDVKKQGEAQRRMARAEAEAFRLEEAKGDLEARKAAPRTDETAPARAAADPIEEHISKFTEPTANWLRSHRDWLTDPAKNRRLTSAHHVAVAQGLEPDSDEYFEHVEKTLGLRDAPQTSGSGNGQTRTTQTRRSAPPVAPVNGGAGGHSSGSADNRGGNQVYLTKGEAASATDGTLVWNFDDPNGKFKKGQPIGIQEMARRKLQMQKQGLYDKNNIEA
jgi:hypothetical protein